MTQNVFHNQTIQTNMLKIVIKINNINIVLTAKGFILEDSIFFLFKTLNHIFITYLNAVSNFFMEGRIWSSKVAKVVKKRTEFIISYWFFFTYLKTIIDNNKKRI